MLLCNCLVHVVDDQSEVLVRRIGGLLPSNPLLVTGHNLLETLLINSSAGLGGIKVNLVYAFREQPCETPPSNTFSDFLYGCFSLIVSKVDVRVRVLIVLL